MPLAGRLRPWTVVGRRPVATTFAAVGVAAAGRTLEVVAGIHEVVGAPLASPVLALLAGAVAFRAAGGSGRITIDRPAIVRALAVGGVGVLAIQVLAHAFEFAALAGAGADPALVIEGESPSTKSSAAAHVVAYLLFGVLLTAVGEEVLFRGALLGALAERLGFGRANAVQAGAFGAWHLAWPLAVALGPFDPPVPMAIYALGFVLVSGVVGGVLGVLVRATGTVWTAVVAHAVHNGIALFVHVHAAGVVRASVLSATLVAGYALLAALVWWFYVE